MRRVPLMLAAMAVMMVSLFVAVAYAATIEGTSQQYRTVQGRGTP